MKRAIGTIGATLAAVLAAACFVLPAGSATAATGDLVGTFAITPGSCSGAPAGSYFRMILPTGGADGPYVSNGDSPCADQTYSPLLPGTDGGLVTGSYQPSPDPAYDGSGNGLADRITQPTPFFGVRFATSTEQVDPQSGAGAPAPSVSADASGRLSGSVAAFGARWNKQSFNQGSPKPDGSQPGNTAPVTGTYDAATGAYSLTWLSQIVGGPFDKFTGVWHLEGTFRAAGAAPVATTAPASAAGAVGGAGGSADNASAAPGAVADATATTVAPTASASGSAAGVGVPGPASGVAAPAESVSTAVTTSGDSGPPTWLVLLIAIAGIAGAGALVWLSRTDQQAAA